MYFGGTSVLMPEFRKKFSDQREPLDGGQSWLASNILSLALILDLLREQSIRRRVLTQFSSTTKGKFTKAIHMDAPPFIIALFV